MKTAPHPSSRHPQPGLRLETATRKRLASAAFEVSILGTDSGRGDQRAPRAANITDTYGDAALTGPAIAQLRIASEVISRH